MIYYHTYETMIGTLYIAADEIGITEIRFGKILQNDAEQQEIPIIKVAAQQLNDYFDGRRKTFSLTLNPHGTEFQIKTWQALQTIPYGETLSYKQLAELVGNPKASRAVGMANNCNPIPIIIPCHRVIGSNGKLVGYAGGLDIKQQLLNIELLNK